MNSSLEDGSQSCKSLGVGSTLSQLTGDSYDSYEKLEQVVEYEWPVGSGKVHFIEEYLAVYLDIKSLRRAYPLIYRRPVQQMDEKAFLRAQGLVSDLQCNLGIIAISAKQVFQIIAPDFAAKFNLYNDTKWQKKYEDMVNASWKLSWHWRNYEDENGNALTTNEVRNAAIRSCAAWNGRLNKMQKMPSYEDTQTGILHTRKRKCKDNLSNGRLGYFPLAVMEGQYVDADYVPSFPPDKLRRLPLSTVLEWPNSQDDSSVSDKESELSCGVESGIHLDQTDLAMEETDTSSEVSDEFGSSGCVIGTESNFETETEGFENGSISDFDSRSSLDDSEEELSGSSTETCGTGTETESDFEVESSDSDYCYD